MKVNNLTKFFAEIPGEENYSNAKQRSTIVTRGDIIKLYAATDSDNPNDWHVTKENTDNWWKMSFDRGATFPLKTQFDGTSFSAEFHETSAWAADDVKTFLIQENYEELKNGTVKLFEKDSEGFLIENKSFKFKFDDSVSGLIIKFTSTPITDENFSGYDVTVKTGSDAQGGMIETPVYLTAVSAIPTVYDETYGTCNYLDSEINSIECITAMSDVIGLKLKVISADQLLGGNIVLKFICGGTAFTQTISVTTSKQWVDIVLPNPISGTLTIERMFNDVNDTLKDNGITISTIITDIKVENA